ncbi:MAG TPA: xanthine dehydrogenase family protein, partial [Acidimicrobiales bacterium]|nr:xanthine dehydrogenase family protein [Acidimicrobiales bacterium]
MTGERSFGAHSSGEHTVVGQRVPLWDARSMVEGSSVYTGDLKLPRMLHCGLRRADVPHALVTRIDVRKAEQVPGVVAVVTAATAPPSSRHRFGRSLFDRQIFASDKVRCISDVLAAVAAENDDAAAEAVSLIEVDYEELPAVLSFEQALEPGAPLVHEGKRHYRAPDFMAAHLVRDDSNLVTEFLLERGDVAAGRQRSAAVLSRTFSTQRMEHYSMEPHGSVASFEKGAGTLTIWSSTGKPWRLVGDLASLLGLPMGSVRLIIPKVGGDFGGKGELTIEPYCGLLSMVTGRPVRGVFSREEEFTCSTHKTPFDIDLTMGLDVGGLITFIEADVRCDTGAYDGFASMVQLHGAIHLQGPYNVENLRIRGRVAYTNNVASGSFRGFGAPQVTFARESLLDEVSRVLGIGPFEVRRRNAWREGAVTCTGQILDPLQHSVSVLETIDGAEQVASLRHDGAGRPAAEEGDPPSIRRGIGVATGHHGIGGGIWSGADTASVILRMSPDGGVVATLGVCDVGQGASTTIRQLLAEGL